MADDLYKKKLLEYVNLPSFNEYLLDKDTELNKQKAYKAYENQMSGAALVAPTGSLETSRAATEDILKDYGYSPKYTPEQIEGARAMMEENKGFDKLEGSRLNKAGIKAGVIGLGDALSNYFMKTKTLDFDPANYLENYNKGMKEKYATGKAILDEASKDQTESIKLINQLLKTNMVRPVEDKQKALNVAITVAGMNNASREKIAEDKAALGIGVGQNKLGMNEASYLYSKADELLNARDKQGIVSRIMNWGKEPSLQDKLSNEDFKAARDLILSGRTGKLDSSGKDIYERNYDPKNFNQAVLYDLASKFVEGKLTKQQLGEMSKRQVPDTVVNRINTYTSSKNPSKTTSPNGSSDKVMVEYQGKIMKIPSSNLQEAIINGAKVIK